MTSTGCFGREGIYQLYTTMCFSTVCMSVENCIQTIFVNCLYEPLRQYTMVSWLMNLYSSDWENLSNMLLDWRGFGGGGLIRN